MSALEDPTALPQRHTVRYANAKLRGGGVLLLFSFAHSEWPIVQDTEAPTTHDKPGSLTCPVSSTDKREHFSWEEPVHISIFEKNTVFIEVDVLAVARKQFPGTYTFPGSGAVKRRGGVISQMYTCPRTTGCKKHLSVPRHYLPVHK